MVKVQLSSRAERYDDLTKDPGSSPNQHRSKKQTQNNQTNNMSETDLSKEKKENTGQSAEFYSYWKVGIMIKKYWLMDLQRIIFNPRREREADSGWSPFSSDCILIENE